MKPLRIALILLLAALPVGRAAAQLGISDCSLARDEIERDKCYNANAAASSRNDTSRQRVEQYWGKGGQDAGSTAPTETENERYSREYWTERNAREAAEREAAEAAYRQTDEYKSEQSAQAEAHRQQRWQTAQIYLAYPGAARLALPLRARLLASNRYFGLDKDADLRALLDQQFPELKREILRSLRDDGDECPGDNGTEGELLGLLPVGNSYRRAALFRFSCEGKAHYALQSISSHAEDGQTFAYQREDYVALLTAAGVPADQHFAAASPLTPSQQQAHDCETGDDGACLALALADSPRPGRAGKPDRARAWATQACSGARQAGCGLLAEFHYAGVGGAPAMAEALRLAEASCARADATGCAVLGQLYLNGYAVDRSYTRALAPLRQACGAGSGRGCHALAVMYEEGRGIVRNPVEALRLYTRACEQGSNEACTRRRELES